MKQIFLAVALFGIVACGRLGSQYLPPNQGGNFRGTPGQFSGGTGQYTANQVPILRLDNNANAGDGSYNYAYETSDGIAAQEEGSSNYDSQQARGGYSYTSPEGEQVSIQYTADENGYQPQGSHLPTPPPIPEAILKSIEFNRAELSRGGYQEGQYNEQPRQGYGAPTPSQYRAPAPRQQYGAPSSARARQGGYRY